jgi:hypothetical protein
VYGDYLGFTGAQVIAVKPKFLLYFLLSSITGKFTFKTTV